MACDPGEVELVAPERASNATPALTVHAVVDATFSALASTLRWEDGIPDAQVRVHKAVEPYEDEVFWHIGQTDATGTVEFPDLLGGLYEVEVTRALAPEEVALTDDVIRTVAGGKRTHVTKGKLAEVASEPNHAGSLVFSEVSLKTPFPWETGDSYHGGKYLELYNGSAVTEYLDGMLLGIGPSEFMYDFPYWPCAGTEEVRNDPGGAWARKILQLPGSGTDYPVAPGGLVLIANAAVDHSPVHPTLMDLSDADFELRAPKAADNPDVPNLVEVGPSSLVSIDPSVYAPLFLARPVELGGLPSWVDPYSGLRYLRVPGESIVDAVVGTYDLSYAGNETTELCLEALHANFERLPGPGLWPGANGNADYSIQRRVLGVQDGQFLLQDTNTSMADFVRARGTPGWIQDTLPGGA
jgi:hypothetical protein